MRLSLCASPYSFNSLFIQLDVAAADEALGYDHLVGRMHGLLDITSMRGNVYAANVDKGDIRINAGRGNVTIELTVLSHDGLELGFDGEFALQAPFGRAAIQQQRLIDMPAYLFVTDANSGRYIDWSQDQDFPNATFLLPSLVENYGRMLWQSLLQGRILRSRGHRSAQQQLSVKCNQGNIALVLEETLGSTAVSNSS